MLMLTFATPRLFQLMFVSSCCCFSIPFQNTVVDTVQSMCILVYMSQSCHLFPDGTSYLTNACTRVFHFHCILDPWDPGLFLLLISGHFQSTVCLFGNVVPKQLVDGCPWNELEFFFLHCWLRFLMCTLWHYELFLTWSVANVFCSFACLWVIFVMNIYVSCTDLLWQGVDWWPLFPQKAHCTTSTASMLKQVPGDEAYFVLFVCKQFKIVEHFVDSRAMSDIK